MSHVFANPVFLDLVDSTNRYVADRARAGDDEGLVVIADQQSAGRGRQGRSWLAPAGSSLLCSMLLRPDLAISDAHVVPTIVALGAMDAIHGLCGIEVELKWPNDLLTEGKKIAGLLGEVVMLEHRYALVIGIGINLIWPDDFPPDNDDPDLIGLRDRATTIAAASGRVIGRDELASAMLAEVERTYLRLVEPGASSRSVIVEVMERYRSRCETIGRRVRVETALEVYEAEAVDVDDRGRLVVRRGSATVALDAGDVVHLRSVTGGGR